MAVVKFVGWSGDHKEPIYEGRVVLPSGEVHTFTAITVAVPTGAMSTWPTSPIAYDLAARRALFEFGQIEVDLKKLARIG